VASVSDRLCVALFRLNPDIPHGSVTRWNFVSLIVELVIQFIVVTMRKSMRGIFKYQAAELIIFATA